MMLFPPDLPPVPADGAAGDEWYTPKFILDWLPAIALDPCHSAASLVKAAATIDLRRGEDGLADPWEPHYQGIVFANPPFSNTAAWLRKCRVEAKRLRRVVVALVPAIPGDGPWHAEVWPHAYAVGYIAGRVDFVNPEGRVAEKGRGHALIVYGPEMDAQCAVYAIADAARKHPQAPVWTRRWVV